MRQYKEGIARRTDAGGGIEPGLSTRDKVCGKIIEFGILGLVILSPLPAAAVYEWSILMIQLMVLVMLGAYVLMKTKPKTNDFMMQSLKWPKIFFSGFFIFIILQIIPLPVFLIKILSPQTYATQMQFSSNLSSAKFLSLSVIPTHTLRAGLELISYFILGFLIIKTVTKKRQIIRLFVVLVSMGVFEAFYGLFELYNKNPRILFYRKIYNLDAATGTFINRNHFSGYLEMIIPLAIGLIIARMDIFSLGGLKLREKILRLSDQKVSNNLLIACGVLVMSLGIIFSKSRSGVFVLAFSLMLFFGLTGLYFKKTPPQNRFIKRFVLVLFLVLVIISLQIGIGASVERFSLDDLLREGRPTYWKNTIGIFKQFPILGSGLGTFPELYPDWEIDNQTMRLYHAHNDYLEYLSELGLVGISMLLGGIFYILINIYLNWRFRQNSVKKGLGLGGIVALFGILVHSITDFNLHIPANMLLFSVVLSLTMVTVFHKNKSSAANK